MIKNITVRYAAAEDAALLAELGVRTFYDTFAKYNTPENMSTYLGLSFGVKLQTEELADPAVRYLIAESDGKAIGYSKLKFGSTAEGITDPYPVELERLYSLQDWIGAGVGNALMQASLDVAAELSANVIWLGVWEKNPRAIAFYRKWGFEEFGTHDFLLGNDVQTDLLMWRAVSE
jgi:diamine N-acetyltransferase